MTQGDIADAHIPETGDVAEVFSQGISVFNTYEYGFFTFLFIAYQVFPVAGKGDEVGILRYLPFDLRDQVGCFLSCFCQ